MVRGSSHARERVKEQFPDEVVLEELAKEFSEELVRRVEF